MKFWILMFLFKEGESVPVKVTYCFHWLFKSSLNLTYVCFTSIFIDLTTITNHWYLPITHHTLLVFIKYSHCLNHFDIFIYFYWLFFYCLLLKPNVIFFLFLIFDKLTWITLWFFCWRAITLDFCECETKKHLWWL